MFIETVTAPREVWEQWSTRLRLFSEPPAALVAAVAWDAGDGMITSLNVWDNPSAVADFFVDRVQPVVEAEGPADYKPVHAGTPSRRTSEPRPAATKAGCGRGRSPRCGPGMRPSTIGAC
jgi:hypothetical protein